ncbi:MAG: phosphotransferase family protein, partial [Actinomycetes bacterium]
YSDASITSCEPRVVRYKPGSRCTIVYRVAYADPVAAGTLPDPVVVKTHEGVKGRVAWEAMRALWDTPLARGEVVTLAEPLAYLPDERVLVQGPVPEERTLKELAREAFDDGSPALLDELRIELAKTARALAALHGCGARYGRVATIEGELDEVREVIDRLAGSAPILAPAAAPLLNRLVELARTTPADPVTSAHHDFRPAQVLLHEGRIGFIDFDGSCTAEPALDLGRFRAKLRDTAISSLVAGGRPLAGASLADNLALADELCEGFLDAYQLEAEVSRDRVLLWETCDLLTTMLHAWTKVRLARVGPRLAVLEHQLRSWTALHLPADTTSHE